MNIILKIFSIYFRVLFRKRLRRANIHVHRMKNVYFPGSKPNFLQFELCFYVQKGKISDQIPKFPSTYQYFSGMSFPNSPFFLTMFTCIHRPYFTVIKVCQQTWKHWVFNGLLSPPNPATLLYLTRRWWCGIKGNFMWKSTAVNTKKTLRRRNKSGASAISHYFQRLNFLRMKEKNAMWNIRLFFNHLELVTVHK